VFEGPESAVFLSLCLRDFRTRGRLNYDGRRREWFWLSIIFCLLASSRVVLFAVPYVPSCNAGHWVSEVHRESQKRVNRLSYCNLSIRNIVVR